MKKISSLISFLSFLSIVLCGQEIKLETSVVTNSVALHPMIFDVDNDGNNDIVVVDDYNDLEGNDAQILCLGAQILGDELAKFIINAWINSIFQGGRSLPKVERMREIDRENFH